MIRKNTAFLISCLFLCALGTGVVGFSESASAQGSERNSNSVQPSRNGSQGQAKRIKYEKNTKVDFDDELIEGGVKNPFQSMIGSRDSGNKRGFVRVRKEWHDQMVMSVNGLSQ